MAKVNHEPIVLDVNHMMSDVVGFQYGIDADHVDGMAQAAAAAQHNEALNRGTGWLGWTELPYNQKEIVEKIETVAARVRNEFDAFVVLGIGGSALGPIAIQQALSHRRKAHLLQRHHQVRCYRRDHEPVSDRF